MPSCVDSSTRVGTSPLRHRDLRTFLIGQSAGVTGSSIGSVVIPVLAERCSGRHQLIIVT
ncbi:hypothetical protein OG244_07160 [Streptomyces brevispora]|uniref:hypothetical protein n=1 Tax=Streptomyces brevispora TaxID=887462 RepID=UPI002E34F721|nr:hypothetical protein [Streptomyces brevispora]